MVMHHIWYKNDDHLINLLFLKLHEEFLLKLALKSLFPQGRQPIEKKSPIDPLNVYCHPNFMLHGVMMTLKFFSTSLDF